MRLAALALVLLMVIACGAGSSPATSEMVVATTEPALLQVPDVVGEEEAFARGVITGVGMTVEVSTVPSSGPAGVVRAQVPVGGEMVGEATVVLLVVSESEITTTTKRTTTTVGTQVNDHDVVASIRRISDEIQRGVGIPTWVLLRTDAQLIDYMKGFCTSSDSIGVNSTVTSELESITETAESGDTVMAMTQLLMFVAVWQSATNNYCPEHSQEVQEIVDQLQMNR